jgi:flagellar biosynthesis protein FliR
MDSVQINFFLDHWLSSFMLVLARVLGFANIGPVLSQTNIPVTVRVGISFMLTIIISSLVPAAPPERDQYNYFVSIATNLAVGLLIGFVTRFVLDIVQAAGEIMDNILGLNSLAIFDPTLGQVTVLSTFFRTFGLVLFLYVGGIEMTLITLVKSFKVFPLTATQFIALNMSMEQIVKLSGNVLILGIIGASPILVVLVFVDIVLGLMSRAAQQINPFSLSFSLKPIIGMVLILLTVPFFQKRLVQIFLEGVQLFK